MSTIGGKISRLRKTKGYTQEQFATEIGVSKPSLVKFEKGETDIIPLGVAKKISRTLNVSFGELFEIEGSWLRSTDLENEINHLKITVAGLELSMESKDLLIEMLVKENKQIKQTAAYDFIDYYFHLLIDEEMHHSNNADQAAKDDIFTIDQFYISQLSNRIETAIKEQTISLSRVLDIFFANEDFCILMEKDSNDKSDFITKATNYLNEIVPVNFADIESFINSNLSTKWDSNKISKREAFMRKLIRH